MQASCPSGCRDPDAAEVYWTGASMTPARPERGRLHHRNHIRRGSLPCHVAHAQPQARGLGCQHPQGPLPCGPRDVTESLLHARRVPGLRPPGADWSLPARRRMLVNPQNMSQLGRTTTLKNNSK